MARAKELCAENIEMFYKNLEDLYAKHQYPPEHIWNCDESGAQAGRNGGGRVWAKRGSRSIHSVVPNDHEWLTVLTYVNAAGHNIPGFYIFKGKRIRRNYIIHCEDGVAMAMQSEAWMTQFLFSNWITHFVNCLSTKGRISCERRHLLIVDGHNSHVTLDVVMKAMDVGLDLLTLPSHTTHRLQPLDVSIFAPFKKYFRRYRDAWVMKNRGKAACKEILAMWVSLGLQRALTPSKIEGGFRGTSIWPLNPGMIEKYLGLAWPFEPVELEGIENFDSAPDAATVAPDEAHARASASTELQRPSPTTDLRRPSQATNLRRPSVGTLQPLSGQRRQSCVATIWFDVTGLSSAD